MFKKKTIKKTSSGVEKNRVNNNKQKKSHIPHSTLFGNVNYLVAQLRQSQNFLLLFPVDC